jgi:hypothetical protein
MSYSPNLSVVPSTSPFCLSTRSANALLGQFNQHTESWVSGTAFQGKGWIQGSIYTDESAVVIGPAGLASSTGDTRYYWGICNSYNNVNRSFCDDAWVGYCSSVEWDAQQRWGTRRRST